MAPQSAMMKLGQISPAPFELENDSDGRLFLTAKTTAEPTDDCGYGWTIADCSRAGPNLYGRPWTFADGSSAVFKTACGLGEAELLARVLLMCADDCFRGRVPRLL